jgi:hypothetical protein
MRREEVDQDAGYALAKATKIWKTMKQSEIMQKGQKEEQNINQEIDRLKQQLEKENQK